MVLKYKATLGTICMGCFSTELSWETEFQVWTASPPENSRQVIASVLSLSSGCQLMKAASASPGDLRHEKLSSMPGTKEQEAEKEIRVVKRQGPGRSH